MPSAGAFWLIRALVRIMVGFFPRGEKILVGCLPLPIAGQDHRAVHAGLDL